MQSKVRQRCHQQSPTPFAGFVTSGDIACAAPRGTICFTKLFNHFVESMYSYLCCRANCKFISHGTTCLASLLSPLCGCQASHLTPSLAASRLSYQISCQIRHHLLPLYTATLPSDPAVACRSKVQPHALHPLMHVHSVLSVSLWVCLWGKLACQV